MTVKSADGHGRTIFDILSGRNKKNVTPVEFQYHNPLQAKVGCTLRIDNNDKYKGVNFVIEEIDVYKTTVNNNPYYHTDYKLRGVTLDLAKPIRLILRLIPNDDANNNLHHDIQLLHVHSELGSAMSKEEHQGFKEYLDKGDEAADDQGWKTFTCNFDENDKELSNPWKFWRVDKVTEPYHAQLTMMTDKNKDGKVDEDELVTRKVTYWDFSREDEENGDKNDYFWVQMDNQTEFFTLLKGEDVLATDITVF